MSKLWTPDDMTKKFEGTDRQFWAQHRYRGTGPKYMKAGRKIFYRPEDVDAWVESNLRTRTDDDPQEVA